MLAIQKQPEKSHQRCTPNMLPCKIHHNGPVDASTRHWNPETSNDGKETAYFRGRKLHGRTLPLPQGYRGVVVERSDAVLHQQAPQPSSLEDENEDADEEHEPKEDVKVLKETASFDRINIWGHEMVPGDCEDPYTKGIQEWMTFAQAMNSYEQKPK